MLLTFESFYLAWKYTLEYDNGSPSLWGLNVQILVFYFSLAQQGQPGGAGPFPGIGQGFMGDPFIHNLFCY